MPYAISATYDSVSDQPDKEVVDRRRGDSNVTLGDHNNGLD